MSQHFEMATFDYRGELQRCIHCGLCLQACPTYMLLGHEADSPRGRIRLLTAAADGLLDATAPGASFRRHLELCLECRACEIECPSGVQYGALVETARRTLEPAEQPGLVHRLVKWFGLRMALPYPARLRLLARVLWIYEMIGLQYLIRRLRLLPRRVAAMEELLPPLTWRQGWKRRHWPAKGTSRGRVAFFTGCVQDAFLPGVNKATVELLQRLGFDVDIPESQTCCGAAHLHSGEPDTALALARKNIHCFSTDDYLAVITNAGGCGAMLKDEYPRLFDQDSDYQERARAFASKVKDIHAFIVEQGGYQPSQAVQLTATYSESCHLRNVLKVTDPPRRLLADTPGLNFVPLRGDYCCGSAGTYNLVHPEIADQLLSLKVQSIAETGAELVAVSNAGCHLQLLRGVRNAGLKCRVVHTTEILNAACGGESKNVQPKEERR